MQFLLFWKKNWESVWLTRASHSITKQVWCPRIIWHLDPTVDKRECAHGERKTSSVTSSAGLDEKHLGLVLEQRTMRIVKGLEHRVQLKVSKWPCVRHSSLLQWGVKEREKIKLEWLNLHTGLTHITHLEEFCIGAINGSVHSVGEQTHHTAVHGPVLWSPGQVLNACRHVLE